jgi:hypothetical protein
MRLIKFIVSSLFDRNLALEDFPMTGGIWDNYTPEVSIGSIIRFYAHIDTRVKLVEEGGELFLPQANLKVAVGQFFSLDASPSAGISNDTFYSVGRMGVGIFLLNGPAIYLNGNQGLETNAIGRLPIPAIKVKTYAITPSGNPARLGLHIWGYFQLLTDMNGYLSRTFMNDSTPYYGFPARQYMISHPRGIYSKDIDILRGQERESVYNPVNTVNPNDAFRLLRLLVKIEGINNPINSEAVFDKKVSFRYWNVERHYGAFSPASDLYSFKYELYKGDTVDPSKRIGNLLDMCSDPNLRTLKDLTVVCKYTLKSSSIESGNEPILYPLLFIKWAGSLYNVNTPSTPGLLDSGFVSYGKIECDNPDCTISGTGLLNTYADVNKELQRGEYGRYLNELSKPVKVERFQQGATVDYTVTYRLNLQDRIRANTVGRPPTFDPRVICLTCVSHVLAYYPYSSSDANLKNLAKTYSFDCETLESPLVVNPNVVLPAPKALVKVFFKDQVNYLNSDAIISTPEERLVSNFEFYAKDYEREGPGARAGYGVDMLRDAVQVNVYVYYRTGSGPADARYVLLDRHSAYKTNGIWNFATNTLPSLEIKEFSPPLPFNQDQKRITVSYTFRNRFEPLEPVLGVINRNLNPAQDYISIALNNPGSTSPPNIYSNQNWTGKDIFIECELIVRGPTGQTLLLEDRLIAKALNRVKQYDPMNCLKIKALPVGSNLERFDELSEVRYICDNLDSDSILMVTRCKGTASCTFKYAANLVQEEEYSSQTAKEYDSQVIDTVPTRGGKWELLRESPMRDGTNYENCLSSVVINIKQLAKDKKHKFTSIAKGTGVSQGSNLGNRNSSLFSLSPILPHIITNGLNIVLPDVEDLEGLSSENMFLSFTKDLEDWNTLENALSTQMGSTVVLTTPNGMLLYLYGDRNLSTNSED